MKRVFLYAGQGSQTVGMGKDFYDEFTEYRTLIDSLDKDDKYKSVMHFGPLEELSKTENTQACMAMFSAGVTELLKKNGIVADAASGLSLGEYGALYAAGVFTAEEYVNITAFRGAQMAKAAAGLECVMSAVLGADSEMIKEVISGYDKEGYVTVANYNCPGQTVICGESGAVADVEELLKAKGVKRCVRLNVSGPFHTKYMKPAGDALREYFATVDFKEPKIPVALNYTGDFYNQGDDLKELLICQVQNSVYMEDDLKKLLKAGYTDFVEIGFGNVLSGFLKKTAKSLDMPVNVTSISTVSDFRKYLEENGLN